MARHALMQPEANQLNGLVTLKSKTALPTTGLWLADPSPSHSTLGDEKIRRPHESNRPNRPRRYRKHCWGALGGFERRTRVHGLFGFYRWTRPCIQIHGITWSGNGSIRWGFAPFFSRSGEKKGTPRVRHDCDLRRRSERTRRVTNSCLAFRDERGGPRELYKIREKERRLHAPDRHRMRTEEAIKSSGAKLPNGPRELKRTILRKMCTNHDVASW